MRIFCLNLTGFILICVATLLACICIILSAEVPDSTESIILALAVIALTFQCIGGSILIGVCTVQKYCLEKPVIAAEPTAPAELTQVVITADPQVL